MLELLRKCGYCIFSAYDKPRVVEMRMFITIIAIAVMLAITASAWSSEVDDLAAEGYSAIGQTKVVGDYRGCTASQALRFTNGSVFLCSTFGYDNAQYMPDVTIYKNKEGKIRIVINGKVYNGSFSESP